ncbi:hypothetical protein ACIHCQ_14320 [Streptomyces sp. NPDC052236]|uniref:hypothetical protein n=1 Tax=Streptomyces sp. NPDC052236 TaxID=3365686 RepID=UPI0037D7464A
MIRAVRRRLPLVLLLPLALTALAGCGTESAGSSPDRSELEARARYMQSALEHIYVTEADGYDLATQSVGVLGGDGFSSVYVSKTGGQLRLEVDRGTLTEANCAKCERDGTLWYSASDGAHTYARAEDGHVVRIGADQAAVDRDTLRAAAKAARPADDQELDELLPEQQAPASPVERGDLPPEGDGAPNNDVGAGG